MNYCRTAEEKNARFAEIIEQLYLCEYIDQEIISLILIIINKYGTSEQLLIIFAKILKNKILLNNYSLHSILLTNLTKYFNSDMNSCKTNIISSRSAILNKQDSKTQSLSQEYINFKKRAIYSNDENKQESLEFGLKTLCCYCRMLNQINYSLLLEQKGKAEGILLQCGNCKKKFCPRIKVNINEKIVENFELMSCWDMLEFIKNEFMTNTNFSINVINFKKNYEKLFWNAVFYFSLNELNFDFLTPYVEDISNNNITKNHGNVDSKSKFNELFSENTTNLNYYENNLKGNIVSNYKNPFIKMNT